MDDLISRQDAIDAVGNMLRRKFGVGGDLAKITIVGLPSAQPDLSGYSDRLWKAAYERGKAEAQPDIIHCVECKHRDHEDHTCDCGHDILWQLPRDDEWYCADAERRTDA